MFTSIRLYLLLFFLLFCSHFVLNAQKLAGDQRVNELLGLVDKDTMNWTYGLFAGLDTRSIFLFNPRVGAGQSQFGFGIIAGGLAKYKKERLTWYNTGTTQLAAQKIGLGQRNPWIKNVDVFRINSRLSLDFDTEKWSSAADFTLQSLLLPAYRGNTLRPQSEDDNLIGTFFSPTTINFSPGIEHKPNEKFTFLYSPAALKGIFIPNQGIANLDIYNTDPILSPEGDTIRFSRADIRFGFFTRVGYRDNFLENALRIHTTLDLFSNYLRNPQNIDVLWRNDIQYRLINDLHLHLNTELFYDDDILVQIDRDGTLGKRVSFMMSIYIKYNYVF